MDNDLILVAGLVVLMLAIPSAVSAFADRRPPWTALVVIILGAGVVAFAWQGHPAGMTLAEVPQAIFRVLARVIP
ncbi:hypothetical protein OB2597_10681 [Pseudooceanicola batsensis HTCC2597]|uniref:50S ribosomal protein L35 n=1 Tax=Pseudooceanicola batsensis (strain ATCC BAA-863 / DSM 15984 / KCTC 12145 / HTCC2597) TaxID=252305 RepID=A3TVQ6_PSEBH|nr:hypothetical protein [Pseudooceanicola batsensis]EAQ03702.1 hypothetical protein OB2597_10681 [Pseudooceanicola batsensis HTCC2597]